MKTDWPADKITRRKVDDLIPYARNARTHSDEQIAQIAASIKEWGWTTPVLIDEGGEIIAGHGRVMAAKNLTRGNMAKADLKIDWATHAAAKYACENWHYSGCMPAGKLVKVGAWEKGKFIGVVLFGRGANNRMASAYNLGQDEACELVRVALDKHITPVSRISAQAMRFLSRQSQGLRLIISYADPKQGHHGGIYQAGNWVYNGRSQAQRGLLINGVFTHKRSAHAKYGTASPEKITAISGKKVEWAPVEWKHVYLMPLDDAMRKQIEPLAKPYPKRAKQAMAGPPVQRQGSTDPHAPSISGL